MKKNVLIMLFMFIATISYAQTVTKNNLPKNLKGAQMNLKVDFSDALICGMSEGEFSRYEKDWEEDKPTIVRNFRSGVNVGIGKSYKVGDYKVAKYTIIVKVNTITDDGYIICDADVVDNSGNVCFTVEEVTGGKEPPFMIGTKLSRMKIWATVTGKKLGSILKSELSDK